MERLQEHGFIEIDGISYDKEDLLNLTRLQLRLLLEEDIVATFAECINIWQNYSNDLAASWLFFPKDPEDIIRYIKSSRNFTTFEEYAKD